MSAVYKVRSVTIDDVNSIYSLVIENNSKWFGNKRPKFEAKGRLMKSYQTHRMVVEIDTEEDPLKELVAYAEFRNYPAIGPLPSGNWLEWLNKRYCVNLSISWLNTLFLNFFTYNAKHPNALHAVLCKVFYVENRLTYVIAVRMPSLEDYSHYDESFDDLEKYAKIYYPREFSIGANSNTQSLYIITRLDVLPKIIYRKALAEDNDDVIEIHAHEYPELRAEQGDFYIAEELMRQDVGAKKNALIVAEYENEHNESTTAGFMWLTTDLDIKYYVKNYELEMFGNLLKVINPNLPSDFEQICVLSIEPKAEASLFTVDAMEDLNATTVIGGVQLNDSRTSVASLTKLRVSSIHGTIENKHNSSNQDKFYMREVLFLKYQFIFEKLVMIKYYITEQKQIISLYYNKKHNASTKENLQAACNVFILKYICVHKDFPLERLYGFVTAMFSVFPDRDYCIMSIPKSAKKLRSHFEALKYFLPVAQRPSEVSNLEAIYITHRSTIFGEISLYAMEKDDVEVIINMVAGGNKRYSSFLVKSRDSSFSFNSKVNTFADVENEVNTIKLILKDVLENSSTEFDIFTIRCGNSAKSAKENTPIGYVILRRFHHKHALHYHYHLPKQDEYLNNKRAEIISLRMHPLFNNCADLLFRNLAVKTNCFDFFFICTRGGNVFTNDLKTMMMLIEPNSKKKFPFDLNVSEPVAKSKIKGLPVHDYKQDLLMIFRHKLGPTKWFGHNSKFVIIGFSVESKAFLRQLVFLWNTKCHKNSESFTCLPRLQVTVIANPGMVEAEYDFMFKCPTCKDTNDCYLSRANGSCYERDTLGRMDLRYWVHFVAGHVNYINREKKYVKINRSCEIAYDTLLLCNYKNFALHNKSTDERSHLPANFIEVNDRIDRFILYYKLQVLLQEAKRDHLVLIYGSNLHMYECIAFLLSHGLDAARLVIVNPHVAQDSEAQQKLKNPYLDRNLQNILEDILEDSEAMVHSELNFSHWVQHTSANFIVEVIFKKQIDNTPISFDVDLFISFEEGCTGRRTRNWLIKSGIVLEDQKIMVNKDFQTNDPNIYAVGGFIEMREFVNFQYQYTNAKETAMRLIHILGIRTMNNFEYKYSHPTYFQALLPLDYFLVKVIMPRRYLASYFVGSTTCSLTTYKNQTFCRIGLTPKLFVDEIVVVTKQAIPLDFLEHFCGKHETMLNNLRAHYKAGNIKCFLEFLQQPWTELLTHEDFECLQLENHKILKPMLQTLEGKFYSAIDFQEMKKNILERNLLDFVRKYRRDFHHDFALPEDFSELK